MSAFKAGLLGHARHAAAFAHQVMLEVGALEGVACFTQGKFEREREYLTLDCRRAMRRRCRMTQADVGDDAEAGFCSGTRFAWCQDRTGMEGSVRSKPNTRLAMKVRTGKPLYAVAEPGAPLHIGLRDVVGAAPAAADA